MPKRKYTKFGEKPSSYECCNRKCKWTGTDNQKSFKQIEPGYQKLVCPNCGNEEFYGLLPIKDK